MPSEMENLPDDIPILKGMVASFSIENKLLREQVLLMKSKLFGRKTEKLPAADGAMQEILFDEPAVEASNENVQGGPVIEVPAHTRRKSGRKPLPEDLPRVEVEHDLSEEEKVCGCGCMMERIGQVASEQLDIVPARMQVIRHIRYKYACKSCEGVESGGPTVKIAPVPEQIIPKSIATPGLLAHIFTAKFVDAVPFYRQEKQFERLGVELNRTSMSSWAMKVADRCGPLMEMLHSEILSGPLINADETTVQVLEEPGRSSTSKSYMWIFRGGPPGKPCLAYQYHPSRSGEVAKKYLDGYRGYVQTDGYAGYDFLDDLPGIVHVGCWAHARRKFMEVIQAQGKDGKHKAGSADVALGYIQKLYGIEKDARSLELNPEDLYRVRQQKARPILDEFKAWLDKKALQTPPKGLLGKAVAYALGQWGRLIKYIDSGLLTPDNNLAENAIRPFVVGRKNWLFSGNQEGANASATLYSLIETAKANGLEPYRYLRHLFENLPLAYTADEYKALMPQHIDPASLVVNY
jgi:transposase